MATPKFNTYVERKEEKLSKNTIATYTRLYNKLYIHFNKKTEPVDIDEETLIDAILNDMTDSYGNKIDNPNTLTTIFNTVIIVKKEFDYPITKLLKAKENLLEDIYEHRETRKIIKANTLPTLKELKKHMSGTLQRDDYIGYIINFLLLNFFTRNKDLDVHIVTSVKLAKDPKKNYIVLRNWDILYIKNNYKTAKTYGSQTFSFRDKKLAFAIQNFIKSQPDFENKTEWRLMVNGEGEDLDETSQAKFIRKYTHKNLSESDYFKIRVNEFEKKSDLKGLMEASRKRGTNVNTVITNYSLKNIKAP
tara:strand:- start:2771 stop:3685 length:915 start_codon:yes stop_codon:yes gene_type:complete